MHISHKLNLIKIDFRKSIEQFCIRFSNPGIVKRDNLGTLGMIITATVLKNKGHQFLIRLDKTRLQIKILVSLHQITFQSLLRDLFYNLTILRLKVL